VPGLCAFLLGICYEYNREPGEITRTTIHPIIGRLSVDMLVGQMARFREDERFKAVGPDSIVLPYPGSVPSIKSSLATDECEIWFDWAFVDFWKSNYCKSLFIHQTGTGESDPLLGRYCTTRIFDRSRSAGVVVRYVFVVDTIQSIMCGF